MKIHRNKLLDLGLLWLRVLAGLGIMTHGYGKIFEFGRMGKFAEGISEMGFPFPILFAWLAALSEFGGGIFLVLGLFTQYAAFLVFCTMSVAAFLRHGSDPFKVKELALAYWTISGALIMTGRGYYSMDKWISLGKSRTKT